MTREIALEVIARRYDLEVLREVLRFADKNPSRFTWDESKEYVDYDDVVDALIVLQLHKGD